MSLLFLAAACPLFAAQVLPGHVPTAARWQVGQPFPSDNSLTITFALPLRDQGLSNLLHDLYDPASPNFRHFLSPAEFTRRFGPTERDYQTVLAFARSNHLTVTGAHANRTLLEVTAAASDIERALHVRLRQYPHPREARLFYAPNTDPSVDLDVPLLRIDGLDNYVLPRPMNLATNFAVANAFAIAQTTGSGPRGNFLGRDFRLAYAPGVTLDGSGQAVGLFELDGYFASDIATYAQLAGVPLVPLTNVLVDGFNRAPGVNNLEVALDIDMAMVMAPGLSKIIVYEGVSANHILNRMATDNAAAQLSCSWNFGSEVDPVRDQIFEQFAAQGQSFFIASGDQGAGTFYPPSDNPWVTSVGGSSLTTAGQGGAWTAETTWPYSTGGTSSNYALPLWQAGVATPLNQGSTTQRNFPDVSCVGDAQIWLVANNGDEGFTGGTSAAAPLWAGFAALVNQQAAAHGLPPVGFLNPALYAVGQSPVYTNAFHDITTGNTTNSASPTNFFATPGYDLCTGWGTPNGSNLINALLSPMDALRINPPQSVALAGLAGGTFSPGFQSFSLTNTGATPLSWSCANTVPWLTVVPDSGTLPANGAFTNVLVFPTASAKNLPAGNYTATLQFRNANNGFAQNRAVTLSISVPPVITAQPTNQTVFPGQNVLFAVGVATNGILSYQWHYDNGSGPTNLSDGGNISGSSTSVLLLTNVSAGNVGGYSVTISNAAGVANSFTAYLAVIPGRPVFLAQPANQSVLPGSTLTWSVSAAGTQPISYQWQKNGTNLVDGGNLSGSQSSTLTIQNLGPGDAGLYAVALSNSLGTAVSSNAALAVIMTTLPGVNLTSQYAFSGMDGANPNGLTLATDGFFYGTTQHGGSNSAGTLFRWITGSISPLFSFTGGPDGDTPQAALLQAPDGSFYGTTYQGGALDNGVVFHWSTNTLSNAVTFNITNGAFPLGALTLGRDGRFYGATFQGGSSGRGTIFRVDTNGVLRSLHLFSGGTDGGQPIPGLVLGLDGAFYGVTYKGGSNNYGTVFRITTNGTLTTLVSLTNTQGAFPVGGLIQDAAGNLYGTTSQGGAAGAGTLFRINAGGQFTNLYSFSGGLDGGNPRASLTLGADGNFYGTTSAGGTFGDGTLFVVYPDGTFGKLGDFDGYNGASPQSPMVVGNDGALYGTTRAGGATGNGTIFRLAITSAPTITGQPASQNTFLGWTVQFNVASLGALPMSYQWQKNGTNLADGAVVMGATNRVMTLTNLGFIDAGNYSVILSNTFGLTTSSIATLTVTSSAPYLVSQPGDQTTAPGTTVGFSAVAFGNLPLAYQWRQNGTNLADNATFVGSQSPALTILNATEPDNGAYTLVVSNALGQTVSSNAQLTVIPVSYAGTVLSTVHFFTTNAPGGQTPNGLMRAADGSLYGTTQFGSATNATGLGTIFRLTTNLQFSTVLTFSGGSGSTPGSLPSAALVQDTNGNFYGVTQAGGTNDSGSVFELGADNAFTNLYSFTAGVDGGNPQSALVLGADGALYGVTASGGDFAQGNIFRIAAGGVFTNVYSFTGHGDGGAPAGSVVLAADNNLYGLTTAGGAKGFGGFYRLNPGQGTLTNLYSFTGGTDGYSPVGAVIQDEAGNFFGATEFNKISGFAFYGAFFKVTPNGQFSPFYALNYQEGYYPKAGLMEASDGNFYSTTYGSLSGPLTVGPSIANGTVFMLTPSGTLTNLVSFDGFDAGAHPASALVEGVDGALYGTTTTGGPGNRGTVFRLVHTNAPAITSQPGAQTVGQGAGATFSVAAAGAPFMSYQWFKDGVALTNGGSITGANARILKFNQVSLLDAGNYSVTISNLIGSVTSTAAALTVVIPPAFQNIGMAPGGKVLLTWSTVVGHNYQLQYTAGINPAAWTNSGSVIAALTNQVTVTNLAGANPQGFYRVLLLP